MTATTDFSVICADIAMNIRFIENAVASYEAICVDSANTRDNKIQSAKVNAAAFHQSVKTLETSIQDHDARLKTVIESTFQLWHGDANQVWHAYRTTPSASAEVNKWPLQKNTISRLHARLSDEYTACRQALATYKYGTRIKLVRSLTLRAGLTIAILFAVGISARVIGDIRDLAQAQEAIKPYLQNSELVFQVDGHLYRISSGQTVEIFTANPCDGTMTVSLSSYQYYCANGGRVISFNSKTGDSSVIAQLTVQGAVVDAIAPASATILAFGATDQPNTFTVPNEKADPYLNYQGVDFAPSGNQFAYLNYQSQLWVVTEGVGKSLNFVVPHRSLDRLKWSQNGNSIAVVDPRQVTILTLDGKILHIYYTSSIETQDAIGAVTWSPDDKFLAYQIGPMLYMMEASTGTVKQIGRLSTTAPISALAWGSVETSK